MVSASRSAAVAELSGSFSGTLLQPGDAAYEEARRVHNGLVDKRPAVIARCRGVADIVDALALARASGLEVAVKGGGHSVAGRSTIDDGVMIDLSLMRGVHVDPKARIARAEGGVTWGEYNRETQLHGLASTGGVVSTTGVAGLTLGGGVGWLMCTHGLAVDNLLSVDLVTADGRVLKASAGDNPDLFWAVRGGGGNFGVASSFEFRLHPFGPAMVGGFVVYPIGAARDVLRFFRDATQALPDEVTLFASLGHAPDGSGVKIAALTMGYVGRVSEAEAALKPLRSFGSPIADTVGPTTYCQINTAFDAAYPRGALNYWKSSYLTELNDKAIDVLVETFAGCASPMDVVMVEHYHGAATRVGATETAFPHRAPGYNLGVYAEWLDPADTRRCTAWAQETYAAMKPFIGSGRYVNYLDADEAGDAVAAAYGPNYRRLQQVKAKYDPDNVFHMNHNIRPQA